VQSISDGEKEKANIIDELKRLTTDISIQVNLPPSPEAEFLDENQTRVSRVFLLAIHSHLYSFALRFLFLQTHTTSCSFYSSVTEHCKGERRET
jgi:hypothetical protein